MSVFPDPATEFGGRVHRRLREEIVIWFTSVGSEGTPQPNPVWFVVDGDALIVYNRPDALRLRHIARNPRVALHFDGDGTGDDIIVFTGTAAIVEDYPPCHQVPVYHDKYASSAITISGTEEAFAAEYSVVVRVTIDKVRGF